MTDPATPQTASLLAGLTVLDVGSYIAGPAATTMMADFGARVIKIEPPGGDPLRRLHLSPGMPQADVDYVYAVDGRSKESIVLDLEGIEGRRALEALVARADVFVTNYPHRVVEKLRLRYEDLAPLNDRLVYGWMTAYGETGPEAGRPGFDVLAYWARSGLMDILREPGAPPVASMPGQGDHPTAVAMFGAVMLGLFARERTGKGMRVGTSLHANGLWSNSILAQAVLCQARFQPRLPRRERKNVLSTTYRARDERWFQITLLNPDAEWPRFVEAIERPELAGDPRFVSRAARFDHAAALLEILDAHFLTQDWAYWAARFHAQRLPVAAIEQLGDLPGDTQALASGIFRPVDRAAFGALYVIDSPLWAGEGPKAPARPPPAIGADTAEILAELGLPGGTARPPAA
ncbi:MAG: CoA transferase [Alphaproteobacteria bacterium]|nr:CoA transferase [Alphaproteobacteria bacterium]